MPPNLTQEDLNVLIEKHDEMEKNLKDYEAAVEEILYDGKDVSVKLKHGVGWTRCTAFFTGRGKFRRDDNHEISFECENGDDFPDFMKALKSKNVRLIK